jgi:hypothetical protein
VHRPRRHYSCSVTPADVQTQQNVLWFTRTSAYVHSGCITQDERLTREPLWISKRSGACNRTYRAFTLFAVAYP